VSPRARQVTVRVLVVLASILAVLTLVTGYVRRTVVDSDQFANRATVALHDDSVRTLIAEQITAVNFYREGDLFRVVDRLNRVR
jgi:sensor domain CHASE-containing protein